MYKYDIAISFAGEDRNIAEKIALLLKNEGVGVFYDQFEQVDLWGKDLYGYLADVYCNHAQYCLMLLSVNYSKKLWTNHERQNAQARAFREREEYILPVRLDNTKIPGICETVGYIDLNETSFNDLVGLIMSKLGKEKCSSSDSPSQPPSLEFNIPLPRIKTTFTQLEKDRFTKQGFIYITDFFRNGTEKLSQIGNGIDVDFTEVSPMKFIAKIYRDGKVASQCKIWIGDILSSNSISYSESFHDIHSDNSCNDWISVEDDSFKLFFKGSSMGFRYSESDNTNMDQQSAAEYFWRRFINPLE